MGRRELWVLGAITVAAAIVRFATLDLQSYAHDEAVTAGKVILPNLFDTLGEVGEGERSPPLYYVVAWLWTQPFGTGEVGLRSLSALAGTATVPAAWLAGRHLVSGRVGLFFAAFVALNPHLVYFSQEARSYPFLVLFTTLGIAFFAQSLRAPSRKALALWAGASAFALMSHYFAVFLVVPEGIWLLWWLGRTHRQALAPIAVVGLVGVALLPLARAQEGEGRRNAFTEIPLADRMGEVALDYVAGYQPYPFDGDTRVDLVQASAATGGAAAFLGAVALLLRRGTDAERSGAMVAGALGALAILIPLAMAYIGIDFLRQRNLIGGLVPLLMVAAVGFGGERSGRAGRIGAGATCALFAGVLAATFASTQMQRLDWRGAAEAMGTAPRVRIVVTHGLGYGPLEYYLGARKFKRPEFADGVRIRNIEVLRVSPEISPPPGFRLASEQRLPPLFTVSRFESTRPRHVTPSDFGDYEILPERSKKLIDRP
jgi:mannosyltransferase